MSDGADDRQKSTPTEPAPEPVSGVVLRDERGLFKPGTAALNPGGRPSALRDLQQSIRSRSPELIARLFKIALEGKPGNPTTVRAAEILLERGYGKAPVVVEDAEGNRMRVGIVILPAAEGEE